MAIRHINPGQDGAHLFVIDPKHFKKYRPEEDTFWEFTPELLLAVNVFLTNNKPENLIRGDIIALPSDPECKIYEGEDFTYRNDGKMIFDGENVISLDFEEDEYGNIPPSFVINDFNFNQNYWREVIDHNCFFWMNTEKFEIKKVGETLKTRFGKTEESLFTHKENPKIQFEVLNGDDEYDFVMNVDRVFDNQPILFSFGEDRIITIREKSKLNIPDEQLSIQDRFEKRNMHCSNILMFQEEFDELTIGLERYKKYINFGKFKKGFFNFPTYYLSDVIILSKIPIDWQEVSPKEFAKLIPHNEDERVEMEKIIK